MKPSPVQLHLLKRLPQRRAEIERAIEMNGNLRKTYIAIQKHGWAHLNDVLDELQLTYDGNLIIGR